MREKEDRVVVVFGVVVLIGMLLFGILIARQRDINFEEYAATNNCEWVWQGTAYGDDRDFICK